MSKLTRSFGVRYLLRPRVFVLGVHTSNLSVKLSTKVAPVKPVEPTINDIVKMIAESEGPNTNTNTNKKAGETNE